MNNILESEMAEYKIIGMQKIHRECLRIHYVDIIKECQSSVLPICDYLYSRGILTFYQKEIVSNNSTDYE